MHDRNPPLGHNLRRQDIRPHARAANSQSCHGVVQFDAAMNKALEKEVTTKATFKGHLDSYRFCDQVSCKGLKHLQ